MTSTSPRDVDVLWHCPALASAEHARVQLRGPSLSIEGVVAVPLDDVPCDITYRVDVAPLTVRALVDVRTADGARRIELGHRDGEWTVGADPAPELRGCAEVDLGFSPSTNSIAIRRLDLEGADAGVARVAWLRFPELEVVAAEQHYERLDGNRWRFESGSHRVDLEVDPATGLVRRYGDDLWRAAAWRAGDPVDEIPPLPAGP